VLVKWLFAGVLLGRSRSLSGDGDRSKSALSSLYGTPHWWPDEEDYAAKIDSSSHYYNSDPVKRRWSSGLGMSWGSASLYYSNAKGLRVELF
jgi:hypothetical protein